MKTSVSARLYNFFINSRKSIFVAPRARPGKGVSGRGGLSSEDACLVLKLELCNRLSIDPRSFPTIKYIENIGNDISFGQNSRKFGEIFRRDDFRQCLSRVVFTIFFIDSPSSLLSMRTRMKD